MTTRVQRSEDGQGELAPRWMVSATSLVVVVLGVYVFVERVAARTPITGSR